MKTYRVKNLYFEFIKDTSLDGVLTAENAAACLSDGGFIELLPDRYKPDRPLDFYKWIKTEKENREDFKTKILIELKAWCKNE